MDERLSASSQQHSQYIRLTAVYQIYRGLSIIVEIIVMQHTTEKTIKSVHEGKKQCKVKVYTRCGNKWRKCAVQLVSPLQFYILWLVPSQTIELRNKHCIQPIRTAKQYFYFVQFCCCTNK